MEPEPSQPFRGDTPVQDLTPATENHSPKSSWLSFDEVIMDPSSSQHSPSERVSGSVVSKPLDLVQDKASAIEVELMKEKSLMERYREVEERERNVEVLEKKLEEKVREIDLKQCDLEAKETEIEWFSKLTDKKSCELERRVKEFDEKQRVSIDRRREAAEFVEMSLKTLQEKKAEVEKKEESFAGKQEALESKMKLLELKEKTLQENIKAFELKKTELEQRRRRSRVKLLAVKSEADSLTRGAKRRRHDETVSVIASSSAQVATEDEGGENENENEQLVVFEEEEETENEPMKCPDSEFKDFSKTISSFAVNQVWALYDPLDHMPRYYARIKRVIKSRLSLMVVWVNAKDQKESVVPVAACGRFKYGLKEEQGYLMFSHEMNCTIRGKTFISMNPRKGETWALFRDWNNNNPDELHKAPYRYDFVEILFDFDEQLGVGVVYLGKVEVFVSVFKHVEQHGVVSVLIPPEDMSRFSHRVPSFRLSEGEKDGVPTGSFELDPAALPASIFKRDHTIREETTAKEIVEVEEDQDGCREDVPLVILD